jgi:hypothetical protein
MLTKEQESKAIDKIRKLLALAADGGASEGERNNAARMAAKLRIQFGIEQYQIEEGGKPTIRVGFAYARHMGKTMACPDFTGIIAVGVGELMGCVVQLVNVIDPLVGTQVNKFKYSGEISDVKMAVWLTEKLIVQAYRESAKGVPQEKRIGWLNAWACAVQGRLYKMAAMQKEEESLSGSMALVVIDAKSAKVKEKFGATEKKENNKIPFAHEGYHAGMNTDLNINRPLTNGEAEKKQLIEQ